MRMRRKTCGVCVRVSVCPLVNMLWICRFLTQRVRTIVWGRESLFCMSLSRRFFFFFSQVSTLEVRFDFGRYVEVQGLGKAVQKVMENERKSSQRHRDERACVFMRCQGEGRRKLASQERRWGGGRMKRSEMRVEKWGADWGSALWGFFFSPCGSRLRLFLQQSIRGHVSGVAVADLL